MLRSKKKLRNAFFIFSVYLSLLKWKCVLDAVGSALNLILFAKVACYLGFHSIHTAFC